MKCNLCPVSSNKYCLGEMSTNSMFCEWASSGDSIKLQHIINRSSIAETKEFPSAIEQLSNFVGSVYRHIKGGLEYVSDEEMEKRLEICKTCEFYESEEVRCKACGCYLTLKTKMASESCPLDPPKWGPIEKTPKGAGAGCGGCSGKNSI